MEIVQGNLKGVWEAAKKGDEEAMELANALFFGRTCRVLGMKGKFSHINKSVVGVRFGQTVYSYPHKQVTIR